MGLLWAASFNWDWNEVGLEAPEESGVGQFLHPGKGEGEADEGPQGQEGPAGRGGGAGRSHPRPRGRTVLIRCHHPPRTGSEARGVYRRPPPARPAVRAPESVLARLDQRDRSRGRPGAAVRGRKAATTIVGAMLTAPSSPWPEAEGEERHLLTAELSLGGMHCGACAARIEGALAQETGVVSASVNLATTRAFVAYDPAAVGLDGLCRAVDQVGYTAAAVDDEEGGTVAERADHWGLRAAVSWPLALAALVVALVAPEGGSVIDGWTVLILAVGGGAGRRLALPADDGRLLRRGGHQHGHPHRAGDAGRLGRERGRGHRPGTASTTTSGAGAFAARLHGVMAPLIVAILVTGRAIEARARARAAGAMHSLLGLRPPTARVVSGPDDDRGELVAPESIPVGALIRVRAGETVPLDGEGGERMVGGGRIDAHRGAHAGRARAGERGDRGDPQRRRRPGGAVTAVAAESVLTKLQRLVEEAQRDKAPLQQVADRISGVFVPVILGASAVTFLAWWLAAGDLGKAVLSAVALLLVACPCAMGLATPVAMMVGCGRASALGILIRSGEGLERLAKVDTVVFDKTGTLTERFARVTGPGRPGRHQR